MSTRKTANDVFEKLLEIEAKRADEIRETAEWRAHMVSEIEALKKRLDPVEGAVANILDWRKMLIGAGILLSILGAAGAAMAKVLWVRIGFHGGTQ